MVKLNFQLSLLQSSVSHDPQKSLQYADLVLEKHFVLLSMLKTTVLLNICEENVERTAYIYINVTV